MTLLMPDPQEARLLGLTYPEYRTIWAEQVLGLKVRKPVGRPPNVTPVPGTVDALDMELG